MPSAAPRRSLTPRARTTATAGAFAVALGMVGVSFLVPGSSSSAAPTAGADVRLPYVQPTELSRAAARAKADAGRKPEVDQGPPATSSHAVSTSSASVRLVIPSIGVDAAVVPISLASDGVLEPPSNYTTVGRWDDSALPGAATGQTVIVGHSVHYGGGALDDLPTVHSGRIDVVTPDGTVHYEVVKTMVDSHAQLAADAQQIFGQQRHADRGARLVLVTCTDYDGTEWRNNFVLMARQIA